MKTRKITFTTLSLTSIFVVCSFVNTSCATFKSYIPSLAITSFAPDFADKYDLDGNDISEYWPSNYFFDASNSSRVGYARSETIITDPLGENYPASDKHDAFDSYEWKLPFLSSTARVGRYSEVESDEGKGIKIISYINNNTENLIESSNNIGVSLANYYRRAINFISQTGAGSNPNDKIRNAWLNTFFGAKSADDKTINLETEASKKSLFNLIFASQNVLGTGDTKFEFGLSDVNFSFASNPFGYGPLVGEAGVGSKINVEKLYNNFLANYDISTGKEVQIGNNVFNSEYTKPSPTNYFATKYTDENGKVKSIAFNKFIKSSDDENKAIYSQQYFVPVIIRANSFGYSFFNWHDKPISEIPNNYLYNDLGSINSKINTSWKQYKKFTGVNPKLDSTTMRFDLNLSSKETKPLSSKSDSFFSDKLDPMWADVFANLQPNDFIGLATYDNYSSFDEGGVTLSPYFSDITNIFPSWLFAKLNPDHSVDIDETLFGEFVGKKDTKDEGYVAGSEYMSLDINKLGEKFDTFSKINSRQIKQNEMPNFNSIEDLYNLYFSGYVFKDWSDSSKIDFSEFVK